MKRSKHSLSNYKIASFDMGELVPVGRYQVIPGDAVRQATSCLLRVSPLLAPVMHPVSVRIHHWFVPYRLLWDGWEDFITGGPDGLGGDAGEFPYLSSGAGFPAGGLLDYLGVPPSVAALEVSALDVRAYQLIYNEYYRDQDLIAEAVVDTGSGEDTTTSTALQKVAWEKDYFTSARPWTQKGPEVSLPLGVSAPVTRVSNAAAWDAYNAGTDTKNVGVPSNVQVTAGSKLTGGGGSTLSFDPIGGLEADLTGATSAAVNDIRRAFALQRYAEARAMYGSRYTEYLRYLGVRSSDARLQRPEYLGGGKQTISFSEVLNTADSPAVSSYAGKLRGHGIAAARTRRFTRFFEEHGVVITLASVRPRSIYVSGVHRDWLRRTKEDFWQKELETIGQQEIFNQEVYAAHATPNGVFGYQDRYAEYRHIPSTVAGDFRSSLLNFWHMARVFASEPTLNADFVTCDPTKRIHAVATDDVLWCLFNHSIQARRLLGKPRIGRIL